MGRIVSMGRVIATTEPGYVVGLDLSLRAAGACAIPVGWDGMSLGRIRMAVFGGELKDPTEHQRLERMHGIAKGIAEFCRALTPHGLAPVHVFVEQYAFSRGQAHSHLLGECGGIVKYRLWRKLNLVAMPVINTSARKTLLGIIPKKDPVTKKAIKAKEIVWKNVRRLGGSACEWTNDEVDAFVVANHGIMLLGGTPMSFPCEA